MKTPYDISELSKLSGLPASTLRFYEEKGLVPSIGRKGLKRLFDPSALNRLSFIALGQRAGFSLDELAAMFSKEGNLHIDRDQLLEKAREVEQQAAQLMNVAKGLRHAAACSAPSHLECPNFLRLMQAAGKAQRLHRPKQKR